MQQIILNYLVVFVLPAIICFSIRAVLQKSNRGAIVTIVLAALTIVCWGVAAFVPSHGSELYGIRAVQATTGFIASLVTGLVFHLRAKIGEKANNNLILGGWTDGY